MTFVQRQLSVQFILAGGRTGQQNQFAESGTNTATLSNLRMSAKIVKAGGRSMSKMDLKIYGMTLSLMNQLSTLGIRVNLVTPNGVIVTAGDAQSGMSTVFQGSVTNAWADFASSPNVPFNVEAHVGLPAAVQNVAPTSYQGNVDIATAMSGLATQQGLSFENNGVTGKISNPYFWGSPRDQMQQIVDTTGINWTIDNGTLAIWPKGKNRNSSIPLVSPQTGMIGYPSYTNMGIMIRTLFNPSIGLGQQIKVQSSLTPANATWTVYGLDYDLEAMLPNGQWFQTVFCYNAQGGAPAPIT